MPEIKNNNPQKPSPSAQILSNVEMLVAMCEEQERAAAASSEPVDTSVIEAAVEKSVRTTVNDTLAKVVETAVAAALGGSIEKALVACYSRFDKRIAQFDDRINQVDSQLNKLSTHVQLFSARFDSLDQKIDSAPTHSDPGSAENETQLSSQLDMIGSDLASVVLQFENKFSSLERTFQDQCKTVNGFFAKLNASNAPKTDANTNPTIDSSEAAVAEKKETATAADDSLSDWERQKQAMLASYGGAPEQPANQRTSETGTANSTSDQSGASSNGSAESGFTADQLEVERLKNELNSKLREAEVEVSINRARLSQERAEFERNLAELDRRSANLEAKLAAMTTDNDGNAGDDGDPEKSTGFMDRFKRHMGN